MKITLHGAAGDVTGSAYLLETEEARILIDFGMFQGGSRIESKNVLPSGLDAGRLDAVLITHAHLDHTGRLPLLTKAGYQGEILATQATIELASLILRDSAKVQSSDVERANRKRERTGKPLLTVLYDLEDVQRTIQQFRPVPMQKSIPVARGVSARFVDSGHMLGSASIEVAVEEDGRTKTVVFSGDIGPTGMAILKDPETLKRADVLFLESTYGDRDHKPLKDTLTEFGTIIRKAVLQKSRILIPAFAVGRTQQILYHLDELFCSGAVQPFPVYIDSPMAIEASKIYQKYPDLFDDETLDMQKACTIASKHAHVIATPTAENSMSLNHVTGPCLIMAGSGMCNAGRILHHLRHGLSLPETLVVIVGFQGEGTLGRQLVDGASEVTIFGETIPVRAEIHTLNGFSAHAGQSDLLRWFRFMAPSKPRVVLSHGESRGRTGLAEMIQKQFGIKAELPFQGDVVRW